jgi:hypothetical protein
MSADDIVAQGFGLSVDLDMKDWLDVRQWMLEFIAANPEAAMLHDLLVHVRYHNRPVAKFRVPVPFVGIQRQIYSLGDTTVNGALSVLDRFDWFVARKIEEGLE